MELLAAVIDMGAFEHKSQQSQGTPGKPTLKQEEQTLQEQHCPQQPLGNHLPLQSHHLEEARSVSQWPDCPAGLGQPCRGKVNVTWLRQVWKQPVDFPRTTRS